MSKPNTRQKVGDLNPFPTPEGTNLFGGKNPNGLYVPLTEDEQEVLQRLIETDDLEVVAHGWGVLHHPTVVAGDHRVGITFRIDFHGSMVFRPLTYLDLELRTRAGMKIFRETKALNPPLMVDGASYVDFQWDIALHSMNPNLVKTIKPGALGLTSRRQDRDTKDMTREGNMKLDEAKKRTLKVMEDSAGGIRKKDQVDASQAIISSGDLQR